MRDTTPKEQPGRGPEGDRLSAADATARFLGVILLVAVGYSHLLDISHKIDEGIWYMVFAFAVLVELGLIGLAAFAMRDLTLRGVRHAPRDWMRLASLLAWLAPAAIAFAANPGTAVAHGGEDDEAGPAGGAGGETTETAGAGMSGSAGGHGDPFLGTGELTFALVACFGFLAWAAHSLAARVDHSAARA